MAGLVKRAKRSVREVLRELGQRVADVSPPWLRRRLFLPTSYLSMLFVDHGIFRLLYVNRHKLSDQAWRSAQPAPHNLRGFAKAGVRTVVNLRGTRHCGSFLLERRTCERLGLKLVNYQMRSRAAPTREELRGARRILEEVEYPILIHCKSGADRAGIMCVLYRHLHEGAPIEEAKKELSLRFGHIRQAHTGVLDYFFERYLADNAVRPMPFFEWVETVYDQAEVQRSFHSRGWANRLVDGILRRE